VGGGQVSVKEIRLHPIAFERLREVLPLVDRDLVMGSDDASPVTTAAVRMAPGPRAQRLVAVLLALGYGVRFSWNRPAELAEWLEAQVVERRNLGPHTSKAANCKASGLTVEEAAALLGWARSTVELNYRAADERLTAEDWQALRRAAALWDARIGDEHVVEFEPQALPAAAR
jgi:hypothetical protein